jgi:hypothetical protein
VAVSSINASTIADTSMPISVLLLPSSLSGELFETGLNCGSGVVSVDNIFWMYVQLLFVSSQPP